jgi:hypothetical protein
MKTDKNIEKVRTLVRIVVVQVTKRCFNKVTGMNSKKGDQICKVSVGFCTKTTHRHKKDTFVPTFLDTRTVTAQSV